MAREFGVDGSEEPFDLPSALGLTDGRVNNPEVQGECGLLEVASMKSEPWSTCRMSGMPHIAHAGSVFRQIACRRARAVLIAEGAPVKTMYPQMARE